MKWVIAILTAFFQALLPWVAKQRPTAEDADPDRETRDKLRDRIRKQWRNPRR
jgi:hypothetical protein